MDILESATLPGTPTSGSEKLERRWVDCFSEQFMLSEVEHHCSSARRLPGLCFVKATREPFDKAAR